MNKTETENEAEYDEHDASTGSAVAAASPTQLAALRALGDAAAALVASHPRPGGEPLLKMLKNSCAWAYGQDSVKVEEGSTWAINPLGFQHGFVAWNRDAKASTRKLGEIMTSITLPKPDRHTLGEVGGEWKEQMSMSMRCVGGEDDGLQVVFKSSSEGGKEACLDILAKIAERALSGNAEVVPHVQLGHTTYQHPSYGPTDKPVLKIVRWTTMQDDGRGGPTPEPAPAVTGAAAAAEPVRRRRSA